MPTYTDFVSEDRIILYLDSRLFHRDGIFKCCYWYTGAYQISVQAVDTYYTVIIEPQPGQSLNEPARLYAKAKKDLFDFQLRDTITKETKNIRDLLVAKAFANGALDEPVDEDLSDPVGF